MKIIEVNSDALARHFIEMAPNFYHKDPTYIRPLDADVAAVFDSAKNTAFTEGRCIRWLLQDNQGKWIGRIAAFYTQDTRSNYEQPTGGCGFFECINDRSAASMLFDTAKKWLQEQGLEAMDGPVNFGDRDKWWGLLVDGFHEPCYQCNYNPPYYQQLFESYGFQTYFKQYTYWRSVRDELDKNYADRAGRILANRGYTFDHIYKNNLQKAAQDFRIVYNKGWAKHAGVGEISEDQADNLMKNMKAIIDPKLIWFAYYKSEPVG